MKHRILISESKLVEMIKLIVENEIDISEFEDSDFLDAFIVVFKKWVHSKIGDKMNDYPMSFLVKKYVIEFFKTFDQSYKRESWRGEVDVRDFINFGKFIVKRQLHRVPSLKKNLKFTEKFKKQIDYLLSKLGIPDYWTLELIETSPYKIQPQIHVDFEKMIRSNHNTEISPNSVIAKFKTALQDYMGVKFGNPLHGELQFDYADVKMSSPDKWILSVFNKEIKKSIKQNCDKGGNIHSIKLKVENSFRVSIGITYKSSVRYGSSSGMIKASTRTCVKEYVQDVLGYKNISIENI